LLESWDYHSFIKPANLGSSIGVSKIEKEEDFEKGKEEHLNTTEKLSLKNLYKDESLNVRY
jgi:D-alanine-D-alanine ligase-like ATP-grasp enzyme